MNKNHSLRNDQLRKAYKLLSVSTSKELWEKYVQLDQELILSKEWDYKNPASLINKIKDILERIDISSLSEEEKDDVEDILWLWYHHSMSYAIWEYKSKEDALIFSERALKYQIKKNPNKITRLFYLLIRDKEQEAKKWVETITRDPEKSSALGVMQEYKDGGFYN